ncbi:MAG: SEC-C domain-containing protein, partial [Planctomycetes bacterium]|nr:SEC-C domain-containing protein [Planctomycetota bacterium]
ATNMAGRGTDIILGGNGEFYTKKWLENEQGVTLKNFLPDAYREEESYLVPRDVLIEAEKAYETRIKDEYSKNFKPDYVASHTAVKQLGGLAVIGTERHESRRIDNQLRGRCGRQGDPGSSQFFLSLDDDLMRMFAGPKIVNMMRSLGFQDGQHLQSKMITSSVAKAQRKVEGHHFDIRKNLKEYDDVLDKQRRRIYSLRQSILEGVNNAQGAEIDRKIRVWLNELLETRENVDADEAVKVCDYMKEHYKAEWNPERVAGNPRVVVRDNMVLAAKLSHMPESIKGALEDCVFNVMMRLHAETAADDNPQNWNLDSFLTDFEHIFGKEFEQSRLPAEGKAALESALEEHGIQVYRTRKDEICAQEEGEANEDRIVQLGRYYLLNSIDERWKVHLRAMEQLRYGVHWESQAQKDPKMVYKREGRAMFDQLLDDIDTEVVRNIMHTRIEDHEAPPEAQAPRQVSRPAAGNRRRAGATESLADQALAMAKALSEQVNKEREERAAEPESVRAPAAALDLSKAPGPNDNCWCGSGKKYKKCHMTSDRQGLTTPS